MPPRSPRPEVGHGQEDQVGDGPVVAKATGSNRSLMVGKMQNGQREIDTPAPACRPFARRLGEKTDPLAAVLDQQH